MSAASSLAVYPNNVETGFLFTGKCGNWDSTTFTQYGTGVAVSPYWVVTARHVGGTHFYQNGIYYPVQTKFYHTIQSGVNADLALWKLTTPVPYYTPIAYRPYTGTNALQGEIVKFVGYGSTMNQGARGWIWQSNSFGTKRSAFNTLDGYLANTLVNYGSYTRTTDYIAYDIDAPNFEAPINLWGGTAVPGEGGIADMDSGCGWYVNENGVWKLIAVSSIVGYYSGMGITNNYQWGAFGAGTHLNPYKSWIQATAPELGTMTATIADASPLGTTISGGASSLAALDNSSFQVRSFDLYAGDYYQPVGARVGFTTQVAFPATLDITLDAKTSGGGAIAKILVRNWATNRFDVVDQYTVTTSMTHRDTVNVPAVNYVRADGRIELLTTHENFANDVEFANLYLDFARVVAKT